MLKSINRYIVNEYIKSLFVVIAVMLSIILLINLSIIRIFMTLRKYLSTNQLIYQVKVLHQLRKWMLAENSYNQFIFLKKFFSD